MINIQRTICDGKSLTPLNLTHKSKLIKVLYGSNNILIDVTQKVRLITDTTFKVSSELFSDPCPGQNKMIILIFDDDIFVTFPDGTILDTTNYKSCHMIICHAKYGTDQHSIDVTNIVNHQNKPFHANNGLFTDPCPGIVKKLTIFTTYGHFVYPENSLVNLKVPTHIYL